MSIEQYQRAVSSLDKEIADLEKKKAASDRKAADARKKAANVSINKNTSASVVKTKMRQIDSYTSVALKAEKESADLQKKLLINGRGEIPLYSACKEKKFLRGKSRNM